MLPPGSDGRGVRQELAVDEHLGRPVGVYGAERDIAIGDVAVGDRALGGRTLGERAVGNRAVLDRAVSDRTGGYHVADLGDVVSVLAAEAVVRVLPRKRVPLAPLRGSHVLERVAAELVATLERVVAAERPVAKGPITELPTVVRRGVPDGCFGLAVRWLTLPTLEDEPGVLVGLAVSDVEVVGQAAGPGASRVPVRSPSRTPSRWNVLVPLPLVNSQVRSCETTWVADWEPDWVADCTPSW